MLLIEPTARIGGMTTQGHSHSDFHSFESQRQEHFHVLLRGQTAASFSERQGASQLTEKLRKNTTVDWQHRHSVRAKLRNLIRRLLRKYKFPPEDGPEAIKLVMQQAEALAEVWSTDSIKN